MSGGGVEMKNKLIFVILSAIFVMPVFSEHRGNIALWSRFQGDRAATGRSSLIGPRAPNLKWKLRIIGWASPPVIGSDGTIYFAESFGDIHAYNPNGTEKWSLAISTPSWAEGYPEERKNELARDGNLFGLRFVAPLIGDDGTIYAATQFPQYPADKIGIQEAKWFSDHKNQLGIYAIDPSGKLKWKYITGEDVSSAPNIGFNGDIYFRTLKDLYAVKPDGNLRWKYSLNAGAKVSHPAVAEDGTIYVVDNELRALGPDGKLKWSYKDNAKPEIAAFAAHPTIGKDGVIYFGTENYFYALTPSGALLWKKNLGWTESSPAIGPNGEIYIGTGRQNGKAYFYALEPSSGEEIWRYAVEGPIDASAVVDAEGAIYFASDDGYYYSLSSGGNLLWRFDLGRNTTPELGTITAEADGAAAIGPGGILYFGHSGGWVGQIPERHFSFFAVGAS